MLLNTSRGGQSDFYPIKMWISSKTIKNEYWYSDISTDAVNLFSMDQWSNILCGIPVPLLYSV